MPFEIVEDCKGKRECWMLDGFYLLNSISKKDINGPRKYIKTNYTFWITELLKLDLFYLNIS